MAEEPQNLMLQLLRDIRGKLDEHDKRFDEHDKHFDVLRKMISDRQETTATGAGLAAHANLRTQSIEADLENLKRRLDRLERTSS